jgi:1-aminocyclopropane-1-carboxylate deaminase
LDYLRKMIPEAKKSINQQLLFSDSSGISLYIKREDLLHPHISGNKYRKLKYNLHQARLETKTTLLTFGGAYSNHIAATAAAGKEFGFKTIGVIRGEEFSDNIPANPTLHFAKANSMQLHFISREEFRLKDTAEFLLKLEQQFGKFYLIPEGGTNNLAVKGCEEILTKDDQRFDFICVAVGTGGTISGLINASEAHQKVIGFSALKGGFLSEEVKKWTSQNNWHITDAYCFGGYAKINRDLVEFMNQFKQETAIQLDPVYTGKMMFGIYKMIREEKFPKKSRILAVHTGGLQGIAGMNENLKKRNLPLIQ